MPNIPEFHFRVPPRKIKRVVKPVWDYSTTDKVIEHIMGNKKMSVYQTSIHDINKDGEITLDEMLHSIKTVSNLTVVSVTPAVNLEVGLSKRAEMGAGAGEGGTKGEEGGGGGGGY